MDVEIRYTCTPIKGVICNAGDVRKFHLGQTSASCKRITANTCNRIGDIDISQTSAILKRMAINSSDVIVYTIETDSTTCIHITAVTVIVCVLVGHTDGMITSDAIINSIHLKVVGGGLRHCSQRNDECKQYFFHVM